YIMKNPTQTKDQSPPDKKQADLKSIKISTRITVLSFSMVMLTVLILTSVVFIQKRRLSPQLGAMLDQQAYDEASKLVSTVRETCAAAEAQGLRQLNHSLGVAKDLLKQEG